MTNIQAQEVDMSKYGKLGNTFDNENGDYSYSYKPTPVKVKVLD